MLFYCCKYCDFHTKSSSILLAEQVRLMYKVNILFLQLIFFFFFFLKALWGIFSCIPWDKITWCHNLNNTRSFSVWGYLPLYSESVSYRRGALILKGTSLKFKYLIFFIFFFVHHVLIRHCEKSVIDYGLFLNHVIWSTQNASYFFFPCMSKSSDWCFPHGVVGQNYRQVCSSLTKTCSVVHKPLQHNLEIRLSQE